MAAGAAAGGFALARALAGGRAALRPAGAGIGLRGMATSWWADVEAAPRDLILGVTEKFVADPNPEKMNLGVGAYRTDEGKPLVLECVREAERRVCNAQNMEYLPMGGMKAFVDESVKLAFGEGSEALASGRVAAIQTLSGTGSCRLMADFMHRFRPGAKIYISTPTWANHHNIWADGNVEREAFRYYHPETRGLDFDGMMADVKAAPAGSFFLLHACAHNPTGVDPSPEQWKALSVLMKECGHFPFFDMAYQGFASGDFEKDAQSIKIFMDDGHLMGCSQSFAKNMGMYGQRIGAFSLVCEDKAQAEAVESQMKRLGRAMYSNPPVHGALLAHAVLSDPELKADWFREVKGMADRIISMRAALRSEIEACGSKHSWNHITDQIGMFAFTGLEPEQVDRLYDESIYLTRNGRISMAGVNTGNVKRLAAAIHKVSS